MFKQFLIIAGTVWIWCTDFFFATPLDAVFGRNNLQKDGWRLVFIMPVILLALAWAPALFIGGSIWAAICAPQLLFATIPGGGFFTLGLAGAIALKQEISNLRGE